MKKVLALLVLVTPQFLISNYENSLKGYWHGNGLIMQFKECEDKICGTIEHIFVEEGKDPKLVLDENNKDKELRSRTLIGSDILYEIDKKPDSKRTFIGKIYNPEEGKSYKSKIRQLDNGNLEIKGCFAVVCRKVGEWLPLKVTINDEGKRVAELAKPLAIF
tara:strand:- start:1782 stop:2267 length:486 start_codon:yes stop_codon:yes gene_type:complete